MKTFNLFLSLLIIFAMVSCKGGEDKTDNTDGETDTIIAEEIPENVFGGATKEFIVIPSPVETAVILQRAGAKYDEEILNPVENRTNYTTNLSMALNLGIYSADMCYASMCNQSQASINFMGAVKKLAEDIGILEAVSESTFDRMEANANRKDSLLHILSEVVMNAEMSLKEDERSETAAIILTGGWIEGLYIATQVVKNIDDDKEMMNKIADQRLSLETLLLLLKKYEDNESFHALITSLIDLQTVFNKVKVTEADVETETDADKGKTVIKSKTKTVITQEVFSEICEEIAKVRNSIVNAEII